MSKKPHTYKTNTDGMWNLKLVFGYINISNYLMNWIYLFETIIQLCTVCVKGSSKIYSLSRFTANKKGMEIFQSWSYTLLRLHSMILMYKLVEDLVWIQKKHVRKADRELSARVNLKWGKEHHWLALLWEMSMGKADSYMWILK